MYRELSACLISLKPGGLGSSPHLPSQEAGTPHVGDSRERAMQEGAPHMKLQSLLT